VRASQQRWSRQESTELLDRRVQSLLRQWDSEGRSGFLQARFLVRHGQLLGVFGHSGKQRVVTLGGDFLFIYHRARRVNPNHPLHSVDLRKVPSIDGAYNDSDFSFRIRDGL